MFKTVPKLVDTMERLGATDCTIDIVFSSRVVVVEKEEKTFPFQSFVAECGGCLGLFLGFSFLLVWDGLMETFGNIRYLKW